MKKLFAQWLRPAPAAPVAHLRLAGGLTEEQIAQRLAGTADVPAVQAVLALVDQRLVVAADRATDRPAPPAPERGLPGYTPEDRLYDAGRAGELAELRAQLQELTKPTE
jgi:hypothetical protein